MGAGEGPRTPGDAHMPCPLLPCCDAHSCSQQLPAKGLSDPQSEARAAGTFPWKMQIFEVRQAPQGYGWDINGLQQIPWSPVSSQCLEPHSGAAQFPQFAQFARMEVDQKGWEP